MPDLITHLVVPYTVGRAAGRVSIRPRPWLALLCLGAVLPDLLTRAFGVAFPFAPIGRFLLPWHTPIGLLVICLMLAFAFPEAKRPAYLGWLMAGVGVHLGLDLFQKAIIEGHYYWFFPFSAKKAQIGLYWPDETILYTPYLLAAGLTIEAVVQWRARKRT